MEYRHLGRTGIKVSVIGIGAMDFEDKGSIDKYVEYTEKAISLGVNFFDTAEAYTAGIGEEILGEVFSRIKPKREEIIISTKVFWGKGLISDEYERKPNTIGLARKHVVEAINASLKRLQIGNVDIVFCHRPDPTTPIEEVCRVFNWLIEKNKCYYWGTSEWSAYQIMEAFSVCDRLGLIRPSAEQLEYNLLHRERMETEHKYLFKDHGLGTTVFAALKGGVLCGLYDEGIPEGSRFARNPAQKDYYFDRLKLNTEEGLKDFKEKMSKLKGIAQKLGCDLPTLAIAWCIRNPNTSTVLMGGFKVKNIERSCSSVEISRNMNVHVLESIDNILENKPNQDIDFRNYKWGK